MVDILDAIAKIMSIIKCIFTWIKELVFFGKKFCKPFQDDFPDFSEAELYRIYRSYLQYGLPVALYYRKIDYLSSVKESQSANLQSLPGRQ